MGEQVAARISRKATRRAASPRAGSHKGIASTAIRPAKGFGGLMAGEAAGATVYLENCIGRKEEIKDNILIKTSEEPNRETGLAESEEKQT